MPWNRLQHTCSQRSSLILKGSTVSYCLPSVHMMSTLLNTLPCLSWIVVLAGINPSINKKGFTWLCKFIITPDSITASSWPRSKSADLQGKIPLRPNMPRKPSCLCLVHLFSISKLCLTNIQFKSEVFPHRWVSQSKTSISQFSMVFPMVFPWFSYDDFPILKAGIPPWLSASSPPRWSMVQSIWSSDSHVSRRTDLRREIDDGGVSTEKFPRNRNSNWAMGNSGLLKIAIYSEFSHKKCWLMDD